MPFALQVLFFKVVVWFLKIGSYFIPFPMPRMFTGAGSSLALCEAIAGTGAKRVLVVTDAMLVKLGLIAPMVEKLNGLGVETRIFDGVLPDPTVAQIEAGLTELKAFDADAILAVGGGSSIDAAKVIAARATNNKPVLKMAGLFKVWWKILPLYVVPTTAGTGSEVTIAAVVSDTEAQRKLAIMTPRLLPDMAALDGALMTGLPAPITAATGMDALTHAVESFISHNAIASTDRDALEATRLILKWLPIAYADGGNLEARQHMAQASYLAGLAFTRAGVGYVHAIAHNFGARYHVPHGLANAIVMPHVLDYSKPRCASRLAALAEAGGLKRGGETDEQLADRFIAHIREMNRQFNIPERVDKLQVRDIPGIAAAALDEAHGTYAVPRYMDQGACEGVVRQMLIAS